MCVNATRLPAKRLIPQVRESDLTVISLPSSRGIALGKWLRAALTGIVSEECGSRCLSGDITVAATTVARSESGSHIQAKLLSEVCSTNRESRTGYGSPSG